MRYERRDDFDYFGLILSRILDEEIEAALEATQAEKSQLMEQYNAALSNAAAAENRGDAEAAAEFDAEAKRIYAQIVTANDFESDLINEAEWRLLGLPLWAVIVIIAGIVIFLILMVVLVIYCCRKRAHRDQNTLKVTPQQVPQSVETEKDGSSIKSGMGGDYYTQN